MEFSSSLSNLLNGIFNFNIPNNSIYSHYGIGLSDSQLFPLFIKTDISKDIVEIPMISELAVREILIQKALGENFDYNEILTPTGYNGTVFYSTLTSILRNVFNSYRGYADKITKVSTNKDEVFYGGRGFIMDENYNVLLLGTYIAEREGNKYIYKRTVFYINPIVFNSDTLINKAIYKKMIPYYSTHTIMRMRNIQGSHIETRWENEACRIVIDDPAKFIVRPTPPKDIDIQEDLNNTLVDNIDDILGQI